MDKFSLYLALFLSALFLLNSVSANDYFVDCGIPSNQITLSWDQSKMTEPLNLYLCPSNKEYIITVNGSGNFSDKQFTIKNNPATPGKNITLKCGAKNRVLNIKKTFLDFTMQGINDQKAFFVLKDCNIDASGLADSLFVKIANVPIFTMTNVTVDNASSKKFEVADSTKVEIFKSATKDFSELKFDFKNLDDVSVHDYSIDGYLKFKDVKKISVTNNTIKTALLGAIDILGQSDFNIQNNTFNSTGTKNAIELYSKSSFVKSRISGNQYLGYDKEIFLDYKSLYDYLDIVNDAPKVYISSPAFCSGTVFNPAGTKLCENIHCMKVTCAPGLVPAVGGDCEYSLLQKQPGCECSADSDCLPQAGQTVKCNVDTFKCVYTPVAAGCTNDCAAIGNSQQCVTVTDCAASSNPAYTQTACVLQEQNKVCKYYKAGCVINEAECNTDDQCIIGQKCLSNKCVLLNPDTCPAQGDCSTYCNPVQFDKPCDSHTDCNPCTPSNPCLVQDPKKYACDPVSNKCLAYNPGCVLNVPECISDVDCPQGSSCNAGKCIPINQASDCSAYCDPLPPLDGIACQSTADCTSQAGTTVVCEFANVQGADKKICRYYKPECVKDSIECNVNGDCAAENVCLLNKCLPLQDVELTCNAVGLLNPSGNQGATVPPVNEMHPLLVLLLGIAMLFTITRLSRKK